MELIRRLSLLIMGIATVSLTNAQIYQFHGPDRDGKFPESNLLKEWPEGGPELLLEYEGIGEGYSSITGNLEDLPTARPRIKTSHVNWD